MLLPGISGSFILLILGAYTSVISALANFDLVRIGAFGLGALTGLIAFSRIISKVLHKFRSQTIAVLTGFLLGSLHVLWPWKNEIELLYTHSDGREEWLLGNVLPESNLVEIVIMTALVLAGIAIVTGLDLFSKTK
jgi:putative membrane protein